MKTRRIINRVVTYLILLVSSFIVLIPFFWMITSSLKEPGNIFLYPPQWIPNPIRWSNFSDLFKALPFGRQYFNSVYISAVVTTGVCLFSSMGGYSFAKLKFRFKNIVFLILLSSMMIPTEATIIPLFKWLRPFVNTHIPVILPPMLGAGGMFGVFMMRQYFITVPDALIEAAKIDGCGHFRTYLLVLPIARSAIAALAIYTFFIVWNDLLTPLVFLNSPDLYTIPLSLSLLTDQAGTSWHLLMAASVLATLPLLIVFFFCQKQFIEGITLSGLKG
jgi:multiple sugar transport system permease protein